MRIHLICRSNFFCVRTKSSGRCTTSKSHPYFVFFEKKKLFLVSGVQILHMHPNCLKSSTITFEQDTMLQTKNLDSIKLMRASNFFCTWSKSLGRCSTSKSHPYFFFLFEKKSDNFRFHAAKSIFSNQTAQNGSK